MVRDGTTLIDVLGGFDDGVPDGYTRRIAS